MTYPETLPDSAAEDEAGHIVDHNTIVTAVHNIDERLHTVETSGGGGGPTTEEIQDLVAALIVAGTNVTETYNDAAGTLTLSAALSGGSGATREEIEDLLASTFVGAGGTTVSYNDSTNTFTITSSASTLSDGSVTNAKLANVGTQTIKGRYTTGTGVVEDLSPAQAAAILPDAAPSEKGLVTPPGGTTDFYRADGTFAPPAGGGGSALEIQTTATNTPSNATGENGDFIIVAPTQANGGNGQASLNGPKADGAWPVDRAINAGGDIISLPMRSKTMRPADLIPGWRLMLASTYATGTVPSDLQRIGTFGGAFYSGVSGTKVALIRNRTVPEGGAPIAFFSGSCKVTALPEASRFLWFGQFTLVSGAIYGYGLRVDSAGAVTLRIMDGFTATDSAMDSGLTISANDTLIIEKFGYRMSVMKTASTTRELLNEDNATAAWRPLHARVGNETADFYAWQFAGNSFGLITDSTDVRVTDLEFSG